MEIVENLEQWDAHFAQTWLASVQETGQLDWSDYQHATNKETPGTAGVDLSASRVMLISSTGGYLHAAQQPFDADSLYGDYTLRRWPSTVDFADLMFAHNHYDHCFIDQDAQVALPLRYLAELAEAGVIGSVAPSVLSFMGYQPDVGRVVRELIPAVQAAVAEEKPDAVLLAPV